MLSAVGPHKLLFLQLKDSFNGFLGHVLPAGFGFYVNKQINFLPTGQDQNRRDIFFNHIIQIQIFVVILSDSFMGRIFLDVSAVPIVVCTP